MMTFWTSIALAAPSALAVLENEALLKASRCVLADVPEWEDDPRVARRIARRAKRGDEVAQVWSWVQELDAPHAIYHLNLVARTDSAQCREVAVVALALHATPAQLGPNDVLRAFNDVGRHSNSTEPSSRVSARGPIGFGTKLTKATDAAVLPIKLVEADERLWRREVAHSTVVRWLTDASQGLLRDQFDDERAWVDGVTSIQLVSLCGPVEELYDSACGRDGSVRATYEVAWLNGAMLEPGGIHWEQFRLVAAFHPEGDGTNFVLEIEGARWASYYGPQTVQRLAKFGVLPWIDPYGAPARSMEAQTYVAHLRKSLAQRFVRGW
jgi:hypothetical protein